MKCRQFKSNHVGFIDDVLSAADMDAMRRHLSFCRECATLDVRIRRSLLVVRNLPQIEPSADFYVRLTEALKHAPQPAPRRQPLAAAATFVTVTAALAAAVYFAVAFDGGRDSAKPEPAVVTTVVVPQPHLPIGDASIAATVPAGIPVWPAMFMVGELPTQLTNAELLENSLGR